jgi:predicted CopG family antitoxin
LTKTLTTSDEVYEKLSALKGKDESFSELLESCAGPPRAQACRAKRIHKSDNSGVDVFIISRKALMKKFIKESGSHVFEFDWT